MPKVTNINDYRKKQIVDVNKLPYDWNNLEVANVGLNYLKEGKDKLAKKSLETMLIDNMGVSDPGLIKTLTNPEVMHRAFQNQLEIYAQGLQTQTVKDRLDYHRGIIEGYLGEDTKKVYEKSKEFLDMNYFDLQQKVVTANHVLEGAKKGVKTSKKELESAQESLKKYKIIYSILSMLEEKRESNLKKKIEDSYRQSELKAIAADDDEENERLAA